MEDRISELPDEILLHILSFLLLSTPSRCSSFSTAITSSRLSRRWRHLWKSVPILTFDSGLSWGKDRFVDRANKVLELYQGPRLNTFTIRYRLGANQTSNIDRWVHFAISKQVKSMHLDLKVYQYSCGSLVDSPFLYWFPVDIVTSVEYLSLDSCVLTLPGTGKFKSLKHLILKYVVLVDEVLHHMLSNCSSLEYLSLLNVRDLKRVKVDASSPNLKRLEIYGCYGLECIDFYASNLISFTYCGYIMDDLKTAPSLIELSLSISRCENCFTDKFASNFPLLEKLELVFKTAEVCRAIETLPTLCNLKVLILVVYRREDSMAALMHLLSLCPLLRRFELHLGNLGMQPDPGKTESRLECVHQHLEEIEIKGLNGFEDEIRLVEHIVKNAIGLKKIVLNKEVHPIVLNEEDCPVLHTARKNAQKNPFYHQCAY